LTQRLYHGLTLDSYCLMGALWLRERQDRCGCTVTQSARILECPRRTAAKILARLVRSGYLEAEPSIVLPWGAKTYRSTARWAAIATADPAAIPGDCGVCGAPSLAFPFQGKFLCAACLRALDATAEAEALIRTLPLHEAARVILDARAGYRHTAGGLRELLDDHPMLAPYGPMGREQLCARALAALPAESERYGTGVDRLGRRTYWRTP